MITSINGFKQYLNENNSNVDMKNNILFFINKFPIDATSWKDATDELPSIFSDLLEEYEEYVDEGDYTGDELDKMFFNINNRDLKTPAIYNKTYRDGITKLLNIMSLDHIENVYNKYIDWFKNVNQSVNERSTFSKADELDVKSFLINELGIKPFHIENFVFKDNKGNSRKGELIAMFKNLEPANGGLEKFSKYIKSVVIYASKTLSYAR